jgi:hypothetical protein
MSASFAALFLAGAVVAGAAEGAPDPERGARNYGAVLDGKPLAELTREEVWELIQLDRYLRERYLDRRSPRERCIDAELNRLQAPPTYLALRTIDLKCSQR